MDSLTSCTYQINLCTPLSGILLAEGREWVGERRSVVVKRRAERRCTPYCTEHYGQLCRSDMALGEKMIIGESISFRVGPDPQSQLVPLPLKAQQRMHATYAIEQMERENLLLFGIEL